MRPNATASDRSTTAANARGVSAQAPEDVGLLATIATWWQNRARRHRFEALLELDDYMLDDIGLTRAEIEWGTTLPIDRNAAREIVHRRVRRPGMPDGAPKVDRIPQAAASRPQAAGSSAAWRLLIGAATMQGSSSRPAASERIRSI